MRQRRHANAQSPRLSFGQLSGFTEIDDPTSGQLGEAIHHNVFLHRQLQKEPLLLAAFGHQANASTNSVPWLLNGHRLAIDEDFSLEMTLGTEDQLPQGGPTCTN